MNSASKNPFPPEDGYELWLRYAPVTDSALLASYQAALKQIVFAAPSPTLQAARDELVMALGSLLGTAVLLAESVNQDGTLIAGTPHSAPAIAALNVAELGQVGDEGYVIAQTKVQGKDSIVVTANSDVGVLYGVFAFLRLLQTNTPLENLHLASAPKTRYRMLNHWDNLDRTQERGYAGFSIWDWHKLPEYIDPRYIDYARACASVGINGSVVNNVNAHTLSLTRQYLVKAAALAEVFRPYGIRLFLTAKFSAPIEIGGLKTTDPLDKNVAAWWQKKADEIYSIIPDFGGFLIKANSEGQPGPHDYGRSHGDGANMLAEALAPHGGMVIWRAFVYDPDVPEDRAKQAYSDLVPQDGTFARNALLQVKNGPIDYQPREPYHPLFGAMPKTPLMLEVQITQEYLGCATHLAYLATWYKETLDADTYCQGPGSLVANMIDGSLDGHEQSGMAGVANIGTDRNWCGHPFAAANWYTFGRLAWDHRLTDEEIADEWLRMTFSSDENFIEPAKRIMLGSIEAIVNYMTPLGLHHIMARGHHYGPGPWVEGGRADWTSVYYHRADSQGIGFDRSATGSDAVSQYNSPYRDQLANIETCPEELLLWFHHVAWDHKMKSGRTLWDEMCHRYNLGVESVHVMREAWDGLAEYIDSARFTHVKELLRIQEQEARWWRDACLLYFQTFSKMPIPEQYEQPAETLEYYMNLTHYFVPGILERRFTDHGEW